MVQPKDAPAMFRIIREPNDYAIAANVDDISQAIRHSRPSRFIVEEISPAGRLLPSGHSCRRWGTAIRHADGQVTLDSEP
jgi:hypothetical protein